MGSEQKEISFSESFQEAIDRCCEAQVECTTQMAKVTCDVWSKAMACYVVGVTKGLGGLVKCYIAGVECFYKTLENVAEELCDKKYYMTPPEDPDDKKVKEAKAEFYMTFKKTLEPLFKTLEMVAENLGHKNGKLAKAEFYTISQTWLEDQGTKKVIEFSKFLETAAERVSAAARKKASAKKKTSAST